MQTAHVNPSNDLQHSSSPFRELLADAAHFWEPRRISYNLALVAIVFTWLVATWPHFRPALRLASLGIVTALGLIANACYCAAYLVDVALQSSSFRDGWRRRRWVLWLAGVIFAIVLTNYWIADEIYPYVH